MLSPLSAIRSNERRPAWGAFITLSAVMCAHALLETARDALFLSSIDATQLPIVYLLVAVLSFSALETSKRISRGSSLPVALSVAGVIAAILWASLPVLGTPGLYALYVLPSVLITLVLVRFWLTMGGLFTSRQAKRVYAFIGVGSVSGAIVGFAIAGVLARTVDARHLIAAAAVTLIGAALLGAWVQSTAPKTEGPEDVGEHSTLSLRETFSQPYVRLVAAIVLTATVALTVGDYIFKATIANEIPADQLATTFATLYLVLNVLSLLVQAFAVNRFVQKFGVVTALLPLPLALGAGAICIILGLGVYAAIGLKGSDGALRHTLHRTASELLYVPMSNRVRVRVKGFIDVFGHRGGQALASVAILVALAIGATTSTLAGLLVALAAVWIGLAWTIRRPYVDVFRNNLAVVAVETNLDFPDLDMASLEAVIAALNSTDDGKVLAALNILEREDKVHLVPVLLLYHPSDEVVTRTLDLLARAKRTDFFPVADRIQGNATPTVHAAIVRAKMALVPDTDELERLQSSHCRATRTTATLYLHALGGSQDGEAKEALDHLLDHENRRTAQLAIARAAPWASSALVDNYVREMLSSTDPGVRKEALLSIAEMKRPALLGPLIAALIDSEHRHLVRVALKAYGEEGLEALGDALRTGHTAKMVQWQLPRAIAEFGGERALEVLLAELPETRGMVQYRIVRSLTRLLQDEPELRVPSWGRRVDGRPSVLESAATRTLALIYRFLDRRISLEAGAKDNPDFDTVEHRYLVRLLRDKEINATERLIRLVGLTNPSEDFGSILRGLESPLPSVRSSSLELLELVAPSAIRSELLGLVDGGSDRRRLGSAGSVYSPKNASYADVLGQLVESRSESLRALAIAQVGAIHLEVLRPRLAKFEVEPTTMLGDALQRALASLATPLPQGG